MNKIWHKFFLLAVLSFMPTLSQAQFCNGGPVTGVNTTPFPGGWKVFVYFNPTLTWSDCLYNPTQISSNSNGEPEIYTQNGVTVNIRDTKLRLKSFPRCAGYYGENSNGLFLARCVVGQSFLIEVEYTLTGKSTTSDPNIPLFPAQLVAVVPATRNFAGSQRPYINVPVKSQDCFVKLRSKVSANTAAPVHQTFIAYWRQWFSHLAALA
jgi:hypothetical protein